jgi:hypothetical protein
MNRQRKKMNPEEIHGKEEWAKMQENYIQQRFKGAKGEIEYILESAFKLPDSFQTQLNIKTGEVILIPNFLSCNSDIVAFISNQNLIDDSALKYQNYSKTDLQAEKENLKEQIEIIISGCNKVFDAVALVLKDYIKSDFDRILSQNKIKDKIKDLDKLRNKADDLIAFFGVRYDKNRANSGGLIYGTDVHDCLLSINHIGAVETMLEGSSIPQLNYYTTDQREISLETLKALQKAAIPKTKDFIAVQFYINSVNVKAELLDPGKVAKEFVERPQYREHPNSLTEYEISEVMRITKEFIEENSLDNIYDSVNTVRKRCKNLGLAGSKNSQKKYIEYYADANGRFKIPE